MGDNRSEVTGCLIYEEDIVANIKKGIKRIIWVLSAGVTIATWIILFSNADLSPQKKTNQAGIGFVNWLDRHYFEKAAGDSLVFLIEQRILENRHAELEALKARIENSVKADGIERWPFMWELKSAKTVEGFDAFDALRGLWQGRLREALRLNENEIRKTFPDIDIKGFMHRYTAEASPLVKYYAPEGYFNVFYERPYSRLILLTLLGFIPFIAVWFLWLLMRWIIQGFH